MQLMGLFGGEHGSWSRCSCRGGWWGALPGRTPVGQGQGLPWDTRAGRWLGGVVAPVMAPVVTAAVAGRDLGLFLLRGPRKLHFQLGWA